MGNNNTRLKIYASQETMRQRQFTHSTWAHFPLFNIQHSIEKINITLKETGNKDKGLTSQELKIR